MRLLLSLVSSLLLLGSGTAHAELALTNLQEQQELKPQKGSLYEIPELYPELSWKELALEKIDFNNLHFDDFRFRQDRTEFISDWADLNGTVWVSESSEKVRREFEAYYHTEFTKRGWKRTITSDRHRFVLQGVVADGVLGSVWSYIELQEDDVRVVALAYIRDEAKGVDEFYVFLSDVVSLSDILP